MFLTSTSRNLYARNFEARNSPCFLILRVEFSMYLASRPMDPYTYSFYTQNPSNPEDLTGSCARGGLAFGTMFIGVTSIYDVFNARAYNRSNKLVFLLEVLLSECRLTILSRARSCL